MFSRKNLLAGWVVIRRNLVSVATVFLCLLPAGHAMAQFVPPQNLDPASATIRLGNDFQSDAWLVYTYDIDVDGSVTNAQIKSSNGVLAVEQAVTRQVSAMTFSPATRNGQPVKVSAAPVIYTWILDNPRIMSSSFETLYKEAWGLYSQEDYDGAFDIAVQLKSFPGRNAYEEVKFQVLAASLASRWEDEAAELQHLSRVVELQNLALNNNFRHPFLKSEQFLKILSRIETLQLNSQMLSDAGDTLLRIKALGAGTPIAIEAEERYLAAEQVFHASGDVTVSGELMPIFRDGPGAWKTGLSRPDFSLSGVKGRIGAIFLVCADGEVQLRYPSPDPWAIPAGWSECKIDITGQAGTRLRLLQHAPDASKAAL